jgi:hypothetical protein
MQRLVAQQEKLHGIHGLPFALSEPGASVVSTTPTAYYQPIVPFHLTRYHNIVTPDTDSSGLRVTRWPYRTEAATRPNKMR